MTPKQWFSSFDAFSKVRDLAAVEAGVAVHRDAQDEWGMTALHLALTMRWHEAMRVLLAAGADTELRYHRTGETPLHTAVGERNQPMIQALLDAGADADAQNYWGLTPRTKAESFMLTAFFEEVPVRPRSTTIPAARIQNAEHLADHFHPRFKIPKRAERESLQAGQAVDIHVLGPKPPAVKVRIYERNENNGVEYRARLDPPEQDCNLASGTSEVRFGPEHVATIYLQRP
ncbi:MAG: ankyrin repeat domain-containing protein [Polyangiales bacterium]